MKATSVAAQWAALDIHFQQHAKIVERFRHVGRRAARRMWNSQTNEDGEPLSELERNALIEGHCQLSSTWPR